MSVLEHGYAGAAELVANLSYFCNFAATSFQASSSQFMGVFNVLIADSDVRSLIGANSVNALFDIKRKLLEAVCKGV